ncbi:class I SAM-dependent methyltransferase [Paenibacillus sp. OAS669]|uniref:class I SAM-dependent methyltransferase n=1 Tax=Paenibacillus sp. OAS669 TaxID=2663821 RepID=UPI00178B5999|nr:class I SAM-dependent methyltransferase [Paenibacillus sp. OAS669]MBE1442043.1 tRNA (cmo5U34)-methyltransferase [Paenibacillus sp. OAS669]
MNESIRQQFNEAAREYDQQRRQLIPCFDDFYETAVRWTESSKEAPRILDLGAGTGLLTAAMLLKFPQAQVTLIDVSEKILELARQRFAGNNRIAYIAADYTQYPFEGSYDVVVSSLSIHHLTHPEKQVLFHKLFGLLETNGVFVNADQAKGETPWMEQAYQGQWESWIRSNGLSQDAVEAAIERRKLDRNAAVYEQIKWLQEAGFADADCVYKYNEFAVFHARKPAKA